MATEVNDIPDDEKADLQREEVHALEAIFDGAFELRSSRRDGDECDDEVFEFPIVYRIKLNDMDVDVDRTDDESCSDGTTNWPKRPLSVEIRYPKNYPSENDDDDPDTTVPSFELLHDNTVLDFPSCASEKLLAVLSETAQNERGMPCVLSCLYASREFLDGDRIWQNDRSGGSSSKPDRQQQQAAPQEVGIDSPSGIGTNHDTKYACLSTHHLLDHKPDNLLKTGHKHRLSGYYKFGTPGIAMAWGDADHIDDFVDSLKRAMPQKKFELIFCRSWGEHQPIPEGWTSVDPQALKEALTRMDVPEEDYYTALGLEKTSSSSSDKSSKSKGKGKSKNKNK